MCRTRYTVGWNSDGVWIVQHVEFSPRFFKPHPRWKMSAACSLNPRAHWYVGRRVQHVFWIRVHVARRLRHFFWIRTNAVRLLQDIFWIGGSHVGDTPSESGSKPHNFSSTSSGPKTRWNNTLHGHSAAPQHPYWSCRQTNRNTLRFWQTALKRRRLLCSRITKFQRRSQIELSGRSVCSSNKTSLDHTLQRRRRLGWQILAGLSFAIRHSVDHNPFDWHIPFNTQRFWVVFTSQSVRTPMRNRGVLQEPPLLVQSHPCQHVEERWPILMVPISNKPLSLFQYNEAKHFVLPKSSRTYVLTCFLPGQGRPSSRKPVTSWIDSLQNQFLSAQMCNCLRRAEQMPLAYSRNPVWSIKIYLKKSIKTKKINLKINQKPFEKFIMLIFVIV